jgi:periplasmic divalent cation tolerance protein
MSEQAFIVFSTFADKESGRTVGRTLVEERLAACANVIPQIESIYHWQGSIESSAEVLVIFKTTRELYPVFERRLRALHPYEVPEIVALELAAGLPAYLDWVAKSVS